MNKMNKMNKKLWDTVTNNLERNINLQKMTTGVADTYPS